MYTLEMMRFSSESRRRCCFEANLINIFKLHHIRCFCVFHSTSALWTHVTSNCPKTLFFHSLLFDYQTNQKWSIKTNSSAHTDWLIIYWICTRVRKQRSNVNLSIYPSIKEKYSIIISHSFTGQNEVYERKFPIERVVDLCEKPPRA